MEKDETKRDMLSYITKFSSANTYWFTHKNIKRCLLLSKKINVRRLCSENRRNHVERVIREENNYDRKMSMEEMTFKPDFMYFDERT